MGVVMDWFKALGIVLVVGLIGPLFWLGIDLLTAKITRSLNRRASVWDSQQSGTKQRLLYRLARLWAAGQKPLF